MHCVKEEANPSLFFSKLKKIPNYKELLQNSWEISGGLGYLLPLSVLHKDSKPIIELLAKWREENQDAYPTQFKVTVKGTAIWLEKQVIFNEKRVLFLVLSKEGIAIGHMGFNQLSKEREFEVDNVVRGEKDVAPGIMSAALNTMVAKSALFGPPKRVYLRVFQDNLKAVQFYRKNGFYKSDTIALVKEINGDSVRYIESSNMHADRYFDVMEYRKCSHLQI